MRTLKSLATELRVSPKVLLLQLVKAGIKARNVYDLLQESDIVKFKEWLVKKDLSRPTKIIRNISFHNSTRRKKTTTSSNKKGELKVLLKERAVAREAEIQKHHKISGFSGYLRRVNGSFGTGKK